MDERIFQLFGNWPNVLQLYETLEQRILEAFPQTKTKVGKTQVSFSERYGYAYAWPPTRKAKGWPEVYLGVSFGLPYRKEHPRIVVAVEPYPQRWTHHVLVTSPEDIDDELLDWIQESHDFSQVK